MTSNLEDTEYKFRSHQLISVVNKMRDEGAQFDVDIPTIVFCGNQSAGKSSLIEAISSITVPRSEGTCTRCPMEVRLTDDGENQEKSHEPDSKWRAKITLRLEFDDSSPTSTRRPKPEEVEFGDVLQDKSLVQDALRRAQKAVLNPSREIDHYIKADEDELEKEQDELQFTRNVVCIHITGAKVNLTLIDLPGIIRSTEKDQDKHFIARVINIVKEYITKKNSIIIATVSCKDEIQNQEIFNLAKEADPEGERTIGVLTKPDTVGEHEEKDWVNIMRGEKFSLALGYYMVKNPSTKRLKDDITFEEAREEEREFFKSSQVWGQYINKFEDRFGVDHVRSALSRKLVEMIESTLPEMRNTIDTTLSNIKAQLKELPEQVSNDYRLELTQLIRSYTANVQDLVLVTNGKVKIHQKLKECYKRFVKQLKDTRPCLVVEKKSDNNYTLDEVRGEIESQRGRDLTGFVQYGPVRVIINKSQKDWGEIALGVLSEHHKLLQEAALEEIDKHFLRFKQLRERVRYYIEQHANEMSNSSSTLVDTLANAEVSVPITENEHYYQAIVEKEMSKYKKEPSSIDPNNNNYKNEQEDQALRSLNSLGYNIKKEDLARLLKDPDEEVHRVIASARAYHKVSRKSFTDAILKTINYVFYRKFAESVNDFIIKELNILNGDDDHLAKLLSEDKSVVYKRKTLREQEARLRKVNQEMMKVV
ncbi:hypothetical protein AKO1_012507 [Acrasis kona]|uniref:P-loop containing nucleoside triphosphate hydrolase protein n=1 Tax=Acrasis kona TaxID=1008807 RepID=A0AAW2YVV6_9EUKA